MLCIICFLPCNSNIFSTASLQNGADKMISPLALRQMVQIFVGIAMDIKYEEQMNIQRLLCYRLRLTLV